MFLLIVSPKMTKVYFIMKKDTRTVSSHLFRTSVVTTTTKDTFDQMSALITQLQNRLLPSIKSDCDLHEKQHNIKDSTTMRGKGIQ